MEWYEFDPERLKLEISAVKDRYSQFELRKLKNGNLAWYGYLQTARMVDTYGKRYNVLLIYPQTFPSQPPLAYVEGISGVEKTPHQFADGNLCLFYPNDPNQWTPMSTAVVVITWTAGWLHAYEAWKITGVWPGKEK